jgi:hypothetical protein
MKKKSAWRAAKGATIKQCYKGESHKEPLDKQKRFDQIKLIYSLIYIKGDQEE